MINDYIGKITPKYKMADDEEDFSDIDSGGEEEAGDDDDPYAESGEVTESVKNKIGKDRRYLPLLTNPELSRIIEARASQIEAGSPIGIELGPNDRTDALSIAEQELLQNECPLYIGRPSSDGKTTERWHSRELQIMSLGNNPPPKPPVQRVKHMTLEEIIGEHIVWPKITLNKRDEVLKMPKQRNITESDEKVTLTKSKIGKNSDESVKSSKKKNKPSTDKSKVKKSKVKTSSSSDESVKSSKKKSTSSSSSDESSKKKNTSSKVKSKVKVESSSPIKSRKKENTSSSSEVKEPSLVRRSSFLKERSPKKVS